MRIGGLSDPRNKTLMKMFNLINIGERAGSGVPNIFNVWKDEGWVEPVIEEQFNPDRTVLSLAFIKKQAIKTSDKKISKKTAENIEKIRKYLGKRGKSKTSDIADHIGLSPARTRANMERKFREKELKHFFVLSLWIMLYYCITTNQDWTR